MKGAFPFENGINSLKTLFDNLAGGVIHIERDRSETIFFRHETARFIKPLRGFHFRAGGGNDFEPRAVRRNIPIGRRFFVT